MKIPFFVTASQVVRYVNERDDALTKLNALNEQIQREQSEKQTLTARIAELEADLADRLKPGTEEFDLAAAQRQRDRMSIIRPYVPVSTAGVFSFSQHQQELFALETLAFKRNGYFLEIGVGTGVEYSNSHLLEKHFGWSGILCEPNPVYADSIKRNRSAILDTRAVYSHSGETVRFICVPGQHGSLSTIAEFQHSDRHNRWGEEVEVQTVSLEDLLVQHSAPRNIDYISLDTEGSENKIIENFDFNKWNISVLTIEHNLVPGRAEQFDAILLPFGYQRKCADVENGDAFYVRQS